MFELKKKEDNKILISNLKARMFRGYHKILKNSRNKSHKKYSNNPNLNNFLTPRPKENVPSYIRTYSNGYIIKVKNNKEVLPFEYEYQDIYKKKYLNQLNSNKIELNDIKVINFSKKIKNLNNNNNKNRQIFLTERHNSTNNIKNADRDKKLRAQALNLLFPYKEEINKISNLHFFSLTKNQYNIQSDAINSSSSNAGGAGGKNIKEILQEDFLYKISHNRKDMEQNDINNNFIKNKRVKKGITFDLNSINSTNKKNLKLQLDIKSINENKPVYLTSKEKRYKIIEKEIAPFKNIISIFKDFENKFLDEESPQENNKIDENNDNKDDKGNDLDTIDKNNIKTYYINEKNIDEPPNEPYRTTYNFKKPRLYPVNYYSFNQLKGKETKYENSHKIGYEQFQKKINLKEDKKAKSYRKSKDMDEYEKAYFDKLFTRKPVTNKMVFMRECRIRDIIIANKLKCEFSPKDIKRILNGQKPWNDCAECDKKFSLLNLPNSVDNIKIAKIN